MITIGAQSNGNQLSGNATSFSNYNSGIIDRIIPTKANYTESDTETPPRSDETRKNTRRTNYGFN